MKKKLRTRSITICGLVGALALTASGMQALAQSVIEVGEPENVRAGRFEDSSIVVFEERQNLRLNRNIRVNITQPGSYSQQGRKSPGTIPKGAVVNSYMLHFDPPGRTNRATASGSATFDGEILGIIVGSNRLKNTDRALGLPIPYPQGNARGLEFHNNPNRGDSIELSSDRTTVTLNLRARAGVDQVRVITRAD